MNKLVNDMKKLKALPPYNEPSNISAHDGYFSRDLEKRIKESTYTWDQIVKLAKGSMK